MIRTGLRGRSAVLLPALLFAALFFPALAAHATIDYTVSVAHPERHVFGVTMRVPNVHNQTTLQMPAWNALYQIRDFASHMMQVSARDETGSDLHVVKLDKQTWQVTGNGTVTVSYPIYWDDPGPFSTQLNQDHAFLNLAMVLLYVPDRRSEDTRLTFEAVPEGWRVAVELDSSGMAAGQSQPRPAYAAPSYDALVDAPVEISKFEEFRIEAGGTPVRVVVHGDAGDRGQLTDELKRIVNYQVSLMGGAPFREFLFLFHVGPNFGGGGMEHPNSTAIAASVPSQIASYSAHELFHAWNVKRIRPQSLEPVDFTREMFTRSLWFAEGVTNTYGSYTLVRTGLWSTEQFYDDLASEITELESRPAHLWQSVEQSSLDAWFEQYSLYNRPEESISYYDKGQVVGVLLDILIRDITNNRASLDDVLRTMNVEFAQCGRFYKESEDVRAVAEQVIRKVAPAANADLQDFFARYISGVDEIPYTDLLGRAGWIIKDTGQHRAAFGFETQHENGNPYFISRLEFGSPAQKAGLQEGDILVSLNGERVSRSPESWLRNHQPNDRVNVRVRRGREEKEFSFVLGRQSAPVYQLVESPNATEKQRRIRDGILRGTVEASR